MYFYITITNREFMKVTKYSVSFKSFVNNEKEIYFFENRNDFSYVFLLFNINIVLEK